MSKDDGTWLNICYVMFAIIVAYIGYRAIASLGLQNGWTERYDEWFPTANNISAIIIGVATSLWVRSNPERREFHLSSITEMRKVSWPTIENTKKMTVIVAVVVCVFSVILTIFDLLWSKVLQFILP